MERPWPLVRAMQPQMRVPMPQVQGQLRPASTSSSSSLQRIRRMPLEMQVSTRWMLADPPEADLAACQVSQVPQLPVQVVAEVSTELLHAAPTILLHLAFLLGPVLLSPRMPLQRQHQQLADKPATARRSSAGSGSDRPCSPLEESPPRLQPATPASSRSDPQVLAASPAWLHLSIQDTRQAAAAPPSSPRARRLQPNLWPLLPQLFRHRHRKRRWP